MTDQVKTPFTHDSAVCFMADQYNKLGQSPDQIEVDFNTDMVVSSVISLSGYPPIDEWSNAEIEGAARICIIMAGHPDGDFQGCKNVTYFLAMAAYRRVLGSKGSSDGVNNG